MSDQFPVSVTHGTARVYHVCWACGGDIEPGQQYIRHFGIDLGKPITHFTHEDYDQCTYWKARLGDERESALTPGERNR